MASLLEQLQALLKPLAPGGAGYMVNTSELNADTVFPYITFQFVVSTVNNTLEGASDLQNAHVQIDVFSDQISTAKAVSDGVIAAMAASDLTNIMLTSSDQYESQVRVFHRMMEFSIWSTQ